MVGVWIMILLSKKPSRWMNLTIASIASIWLSFKVKFIRLLGFFDTKIAIQTPTINPWPGTTAAWPFHQTLPSLAVGGAGYARLYTVMLYVSHVIGFVQSRHNVTTSILVQAINDKCANYRRKKKLTT